MLFEIIDVDNNKDLDFSFMAFILNRLDHNYFTPVVVEKLFSEEAMMATGLMRKRKQKKTVIKEKKEEVESKKEN